MKGDYFHIGDDTIYIIFIYKVIVFVGIVSTLSTFVLT